MKILMGYDGSECAQAALIDLKRSGLPDKSEILILSVADVFIPPKSDNSEDEIFPEYVPHGVKLAREHAQKSFDESEKMVEEAGKKVRKMFPQWKVKTEAIANTPHWAIIAKTEEWKPDLVIVGSHGRTALGRFILGSVSQKVLYETDCSVRIARGRDLPKGLPVKLVLGIDGSPDADAMIETVAARNWKKGPVVKLVTAVENFHQYAVDPEHQLSRIRDIQNVAIEKLTQAGLEATAVITHEDPKHFLVYQAEKWGADCIFLGAKGHRFFERLLVGSVSSTVAARAHCSVEVVRKNNNR